MGNYNILLCSDVGDTQSWGISAIGNATGFIRNQQNLSIWTKTHYGSCPKFLVDHINRVYKFDVVINQGLPTQMFFLKKIYGDILKVTLNCWDSSLISEVVANDINQIADASICLSKFTEKAFRDAGVTIPIHVGGQGVDTNMFKCVDRQKRDKFKFLFVGVAQGRKGTNELRYVFEDTLGDRDDCELIIKSTGWGKLPEKSRCNNVRFIHDEYSRTEIANLYADCDCFVCPTHGDSFMLPGLEAMATGMPLLITDFGGPKEYLNDRTGYPLKYKEVDCGYLPGKQAEPDKEHLAYLLKYILEHQDEAKEKGKHGAQWAREYWSWEADARRIIEFFDSQIQR